MAEEKRPLESEPQAAPEASTPDVPGAPAPDLSGDISQPVHDGPAQPDPGDVVISFEKIDELLKERRDAAREKVEQESPPEPSAEGGKEEKTKPEPEQPKPRRGRPPKEKAVSEDKDTKAATPRRGRPPKADKAAPDKATPPKPRDTLDVLTKWLTKVKCSGIVYLARALYNERSKRMNTIQELQKLREELIREIDEKFDWIIDEVKKESVPSRQKESRKPRNYEIIYPLNVGAGIFKGKRPTGVIFADGRRTENPTWKSVAEELLKDCCKDSDQRQALMDLRGKVLGRNRVLLGSETGKMRSPVKIDEALYIETHYDAETLMRILTTRILDMVGYDYSKIRIAVKAE